MSSKPGREQRPAGVLLVWPGKLGRDTPGARQRLPVWPASWQVLPIH